jgi:hypothetical protein
MLENTPPPEHTVGRGDVLRRLGDIASVFQQR